MNIIELIDITQDEVLVMLSRASRAAALGGVLEGGAVGKSLKFWGERLFGASELDIGKIL